MCDQAEGSVRPSFPPSQRPQASKSTGGKGKENRHAGLFKKRLEAAFFSSSAENSSFFLYEFLMVKPSRKSPWDSCCPICLGDFQLQMQRVRFAPLFFFFFPGNRQFLVHDQTGNSLAGTGMGLHKPPRG